MGHYFSWEEDEANKLGHQDERNHRTDFTHSKYAYDGEDRAYWDGREEEAKAEKRREEEREDEERQEREDHERYLRNLRRHEEAVREQEQEEDYERQRQSELAHDLDSALEAQREEESWRELERECAIEEYLNEVPITEEELFMQIEEDERRTQEIKPDSN
jgi:hypothetical protein